MPQEHTACATQENTFSRFVESFKKQFAERELESLVGRTASRQAGKTPKCICMVALSPEGDQGVVGTLDLRPPAAATGVPPPSIPEAGSSSPAFSGPCAASLSLLTPALLPTFLLCISSELAEHLCTLLKPPSKSAKLSQAVPHGHMAAVVDRLNEGAVPETLPWSKRKMVEPCIDLLVVDTHQVSGA